MGYKISWLGIKGVSKGRLLDLFGFRDTVVHDETNEAPFSCAELPTGWSVLWSNNCEWADEMMGALAGELATVLTCRLHEGIMWSEVAAFDAGGQLWSLVYDASAGVADLTESGVLPSHYVAIKERAFEDQKASGGMNANVDYIFDVPIALGEAFTGFRHDRWQFDWGLPYFTVVDPIA